MGRRDRDDLVEVGCTTSQNKRLKGRLQSRGRLRPVCWLLEFRAGKSISAVCWIEADGRLGGGLGVLNRETWHTSFEPLPNPDTTSPFIRRGNGGSGPESGPMIVGRRSGRIIFAGAHLHSQERY